MSSTLEMASKTPATTTTASPGEPLSNVVRSVAQPNTPPSGAPSLASSAEASTTPTTTLLSSTSPSSSPPSQASVPASSSRPRAAVLGAGISGLSASLSLRRAGWSVTIFERSLFANETGAAITLPPNASLCLSRWGFDFEKVEPVPNWSSRLARADTLEVVKSEEYKGFGEDMGGGKGGSWGVHRADLHGGLRELVTREGVEGKTRVDGEMDGANVMNGVTVQKERNKEGGKVVDGGPVRIELGREVVGLDCEQGVVGFKDGTKLEGWDLVVVADGAHSKLLPFILSPSPRDFDPQDPNPQNLNQQNPNPQNPNPQEPQEPQPTPLSLAHPTNRSIYRFLLPLSPTSPLLTNPHLRPHFLPYSQGGPLPGFLSWHDPIRDVLWVSYPCRGGRVINNAIVHDTQPGEAGESPGRGWSTAVGREEVLRVLEGFHGAVRGLVEIAYDGDGDAEDGEGYKGVDGEGERGEKAVEGETGVEGTGEKERGTGEKGIKVHHLFKRPALNSFVRGKAVVIGDAAHVMMPTHAAGGAIAIESAATMEVLFRGFPFESSQLEEFVERRLKLFDQLRIPRCNLTMLASNAGPKWLNVEGVEEEVRRYYKGPLPHKDALPWSKEFREVLFCYDAFKAAEEAVRKQEEAAAAGSSAEAKNDSKVKVKFSVVKAENM